jgi:LEA14-like dessication related protein
MWKAKIVSSLSLFGLLLGSVSASATTLPQVQFSGMHLLGVEHGDALFRVKVRVNNPNSTEIPPAHGRVNLSLLHQPVGYGTLPPTGLAARSAKTIDLPVVLSLRALGSLLPALISQRFLSWTAQGYVQSGPARIPIERSGTIASAELAPVLRNLLFGG